MIPALGGWKVLGTWDSAKWDLNSALKKVQNEFMVFALYRPRPSVRLLEGVRERERERERKRESGRERKRER